MHLLGRLEGSQGCSERFSGLMGWATISQAVRSESGLSTKRSSRAADHQRGRAAGLCRLNACHSRRRQEHQRACTRHESQEIAKAGLKAPRRPGGLPHKTLRINGLQVTFGSAVSLRYPRALSRVSTTTGRALSGGAKSPPLPNRINRLNLPGRVHSLCGRTVPVPGSQGTSGGLEAPLESARSDSASFAGRQRRWRARVWNRERPGSFPYVDPATRFTPQWVVRWLAYNTR